MQLLIHVPISTVVDLAVDCDMWIGKYFSNFMGMWLLIINPNLNACDANFKDVLAFEWGA